MGNCFGRNLHLQEGSSSQIYAANNTIEDKQNKQKYQVADQPRNLNIANRKSVRRSYRSPRTISETPGNAIQTKQLDFVRGLVVHVTNKCNWLPMNSNQETVRCVPLPSNSAEYTAIENSFRCTNKKFFKVCGIERIQNPYLYAAYLCKKEELLSRYDGDTKEELLFHGTKKENVDRICSDNFDWRPYGKNKGYRFGRGVCFSRIAYYATHYCDENSNIKVMLVAKVLISQSCLRESEMILPPESFDTTDNKNKHVTVKYEDNEFYPAYKIYYYKCSSK